MLPTGIHYSRSLNSVDVKSIYNIIFTWIIINTLLYFFGYKPFLLGSLGRLFSFLESLSDTLSWDPWRFFPCFSNASDFSRAAFGPSYLGMLFFSPYDAAKYITETKTHYCYYWKSSILLSVPIFWVTGIAYVHWFPFSLNVVSPSFFHWDLHCSFTSPSVFEVLSNQVWGVI